MNEREIGLAICSLLFFTAVWLFSFVLVTILVIAVAFWSSWLVIRGFKEKTFIPSPDCNRSSAVSGFLEIGTETIVSCPRPVSGPSRLIENLKDILLRFLKKIRREQSQLHLADSGQIITVDIRLISHYLNRYMSERFPGKKIGCRIQLMHNQIHIVAELPKTFAKSVERELRQLFDTVIGYHDPLYFNIE